MSLGKRVTRTSAQTCHTPNSVARAAETPAPRALLDPRISNQPCDRRKARDTNPTRTVKAIANIGGILPKYGSKNPAPP